MFPIAEIMFNLKCYMADPRAFAGFGDLFFPQLETYLCENENRAKDFLQKCTEDELVIASYAFEGLGDAFGKPFVEWLTDFCSTKPPNEHIKEELNWARKENGLEPLP